MSGYPLIRTKVRVPRLRDSMLRRPRLVNFIHANVQHKLILVSAAAGYGKTSLLIDYAHDTDLPVCWFSLDRNDANAATFVEYLVAAIRERFPSFGDSILAYLEGQYASTEDVDPLVRLIVNEIEERCSQYFVLILDDYHEVVDSEPVNVLLDGLLRYLPEQCHIILASRVIPRRLTLTRLAALQEVVGLGMDDLRFSPEEIRGVLTKLGFTELTPEQVEILANRTEGWITGVLLAAQADHSGAIKDILELTGANASVFDYMAEEVFRRQEPEVQEFLLGSALLAEMSPALCDALLDIEDSAQHLRDLVERNLFTIPLDTEGSWYQYHQMFREFLVAKFERDDRDRYRALCLRQAQIMAHRGDWSAAIEGYLAAGAYGQAAEIMEIVVQEVFASGEWETLKRWLDALPEQVIAQRPLLLLFRAKVGAETGELDLAARLSDECSRLYSQRGDDVGVARSLLQLAGVQRYRGRLQEGISLGQQALDLVGDHDPLTAVRAWREMGICHFMAGNVAEGVEELERALSLARGLDDETSIAFVALDLGTVELSRGDLNRAHERFQHALLYWRRIGNQSGLANALLNLAVVHHQQGQYAEAEVRLQEALAKARNVSNARIEAYALASLGDLCRDTRRYSEALEHYQEARQLASQSGFSRLLIYCFDAEGDALRLMGDLTTARERLAEALSMLDSQSMHYEEGLCRLSLGALRLAEGAPEEARQELRLALSLLEQVDSRRDMARAHLYLAAAAQAINDRQGVAQALQVAAKISAELGTLQFIIAESPAIEGVLEYAAQQGLGSINYPLVRLEIERLALPAEAGMDLSVAQSAPQLEFYGLRGGRVLKSGALVTDWESASAHQMLFLFLTYPEGLRRDQAIAMLWPEISQERGNGLFHSSLYRLRSALFKDIIVHRNGIYRLNPGLRFYYDVEHFERLALQGQGDDQVAHAARVEAISLYRTPFLDGLDCEWSLEVREALDSQMVDLLIREGQYLAGLDLLAEAEAAFAHARALDPYDERAYRGIMWCRAQRRDFDGAARQYRECVRILREELAIDPSPETSDLYAAIRSGDAIPSLQ